MSKDETTTGADDVIASPIDDMSDALFTKLVDDAFDLFHAGNPTIEHSFRHAFAMVFAGGMIAARAHSDYMKEHLAVASIPSTAQFPTDKAELLRKFGIGMVFDKHEHEKNAMMCLGLNDHVFLLMPNHAQNIAEGLRRYAEAMGAKVVEMPPADDTTYVRA